MFDSLRRPALAVVATGLLLFVQACGATSPAVSLPAPAIDVAATASKAPQTAVLAGGCFWGVEAVFRHVKGVTSAVSGYAGGTAKTADYHTVSSGSTGHAEVVRVVFDPTKISYGQILKVYFSVAHDPTQLNRQGPDWGTQYRSAIFTTNEEQARVAKSYIEQLDRAKVFGSPIVTQVTALPEFFPAEPYHQNYAALHPMDPYIVFNDAPKVANLREKLPDLYQVKQDGK